MRTAKHEEAPAPTQPKFSIGDWVWLPLGEVVRIASREHEVKKWGDGSLHGAWHYRVRVVLPDLSEHVPETLWHEEVIRSPAFSSEAECIAYAQAESERAQAAAEQREVERQARWAANGGKAPTLVATCCVCGKTEGYPEGSWPGPKKRVGDDGWCGRYPGGGMTGEMVWLCSDRCASRDTWRGMTRWQKVHAILVLPLRPVFMLPKWLGASYCPCCQPGLRGYFGAIAHRLFPPQCASVVDDERCDRVAGSRCKECGERQCMSHAMSGWHGFEAHGAARPTPATLSAFGLDALGRTT